MSSLPIYTCTHTPVYRLTYRCNETGNYCVELCEDCRAQESDEHLIREAPINDAKELARGLEVK